TLAAGQYYAVTLEYYERGGGAVARLQWQKPGDAAFSTLPAGNLFHCGTAAVAPGGFNAFETSTPAGSITGVIRTKVAAQAFDLAVVALNLAKTGVETAFEGDVRIELLDASAGGVIDTNGCNASWTPLPAFVPPTLAFTAADLGRKNITLTENNVWRDVRVRMSYPATGAPTVIGCSTDNFAIRPAALGFAATDLDWQTAGTARTLNNAAFPGGAVHKAGQPFTLSVTGYNATSAVATNYNGSPAASLVGYVLPALGACPTCLLNAGTFAGAGGTVVSSAATYSEAGVIQMQAYDDTFSAVDAGDGSSVAERTAYSTISTVGRFVPDHFTLTTGAVSAACTVGAPPFTYMNQSYQSLSATVQAQNAAGNLTVNYDSAGFAPGNLATVAWQAENADNGIDLSARLNVPSPSPTWAGGAFSVSTAAAGFRRATPDNPDGPFDNLQLGVRLTDPDGVTLNGMDMNAASAGACAPCNAKAVGATTSVRFGRLRLGNAHGSELRQLRMPVSADYWNGIGFVGNVADNCTGVGATTLNAAPSTCTLAPPVTGVGSTLSSGSATLTLGPPNVRGCADIRLATPAWLQGNWDGTDQLGDGNLYDDDASARASFGTFRDRMIFRREVTR
ncbi:MAG: hypothetical protein K8F56_02605, partial [Rhodocyclaceae bacterium]|nr:hypothetical protein [Rhodocyclaceae bacterium]